MAEANKKTTKKTAKKNYTYAVGRRKTATARVRLYDTQYVPGHDEKVQLLVNNKPAEVYFPGVTQKSLYRQPFILTNTLNKYSASVKVEGSGKSGQLDAAIHGIARALNILDPEKFRPTLKQAGLLTRDPRKKQRRMVGTGGKARRKKQSPKR